MITVPFRDLENEHRVDSPTRNVIRRLTTEGSRFPLLKTEIQEYLDSPVSEDLNFQRRNSVWLPFENDFRIEPKQTKIDESAWLRMVENAVTTHSTVNLYGYREPSGLLCETRTDRGLFVRRNKDFLSNFPSKERNDIRKVLSQDSTLDIGWVTCDVVEDHLELLISSWVCKHNVDDLSNLFDELANWLWTLEKVKEGNGSLFGGFVDEKLVSLVGLTRQPSFGFGTDHFVFQSFWQLPYATPRLHKGYKPTPLGTRMLAFALDVATSGDLGYTAEAVSLTWPSFRGHFVWPYEAYKRKFTNFSVECYSCFATREKVFPPYFDLNTGESIVQEA